MNKIVFKNSTLINKDAKSIKNILTAIAKILALPPIGIKHTEILNLLSQCYGYRNYHELSCHFSEDGLQIKDLTIEQKDKLLDIYSIKILNFLKEINLTEFNSLFLTKVIINDFKKQYLNDFCFKNYCTYQEIENIYDFNILNTKELFIKEKIFNLILGNELPVLEVLEKNQVIPILINDDELAIQYYFRNDFIQTLFFKNNINFSEQYKILLPNAAFGKAKRAINRQKYLIKNEPNKLQKNDFNNILINFANHNGSCISFESEEIVHGDIYGQYYPLTRRKISNLEILEFVGEIIGKDKISKFIESDSDFEGIYRIKVAPSIKKYFRYYICNIGKSDMKGGYINGISLVLKSTPSRPPSLKNLEIHPLIIKKMEARDGIICVAGRTNDGKSTLLASMMQNIIENPLLSKKILTYEKPIEFFYDLDQSTSKSIMIQNELPDQMKKGDFKKIIRGALKRKPHIILIGEARDAEKIESIILASMTGHLVYTALNAGGVGDAIWRMIGVFPKEEKNMKAHDLFSSLQVVISQMLVTNLKGTQTALREYLIFTQEIVDECLPELASLAVLKHRNEFLRKMHDIVEKYGHSFAKDAKLKYEAGIIDEKVFKEISKFSLKKNIY